MLTSTQRQLLKPLLQRMTPEQRDQLARLPPARKQAIVTAMLERAQACAWAMAGHHALGGGA